MIMLISPTKSKISILDAKAAAEKEAAKAAKKEAKAGAYNRPLFSST